MEEGTRSSENREGWYEVPEVYSHLIDDETYKHMFGFIENYFREKNEPITCYDAGFLTVLDDEKREMKYGLDNLVRAIAAAKWEDHESVVYSHFNKVNFPASAYSFFFKDYEHGRTHLKIVLKHEEVLSERQFTELVTTQHFPGTRSILVFDFDNQLRYLRHEDVEEWQKTPDQLFEEALNNIALEEVAVTTLSHPNGYTFYSFVSGDFASVRTIRLAENAPFSIGHYGALVMVPTKGAAFAAPLEDDKIIDRIQVIAPLTVELYQKEPGNITTDFFWFYDGRYEVFPATPAGAGSVRVRLPKALEQLLKSSQA